MTLDTLILFAATELVLSLAPGPAALLIISQGMRSGFRASMLGGLGVMTAEVVYFGISALGLAALLLTYQALFLIVKWAGAAYLVYLGVRMLIGTPAKGDASPVARAQSSHQTFYRQGLVLHLTNPKAILFFTAFLPQFIDSQRAAAPQFFILLLIALPIQFLVLLLDAWLADKGGHWLRHSRFAIWIDRVAGAFLIGAGVKLALTRR